MSKYCTSCGASLADNAKFCDSCGTKQGDAFPVQQQYQQPISQNVQPQCNWQPQYAQSTIPSLPEKKNRKNIFIAAGAGLLVVALIVVGIITSGFGLFRKTGENSASREAIVVQGGNNDPGTVKEQPTASDRPVDNPLAITDDLTGSSDVSEFMDTFGTGMNQLRELSDEYSKIGLYIQANWFDSFGAASSCALRLYIDSLIGIKGGVIPVEDKPRISDWDEIGLLNIASPLPWAFESFTLRADGMTAKAEEAWANAIENPLFTEEFTEIATLFESLSAEELLSVRDQVITYEDELLDATGSFQPSFERVSMGWSDTYYLEKGINALKVDETDYYSAFDWYHTALCADPFDPQNYYLCSLMCLEMEDIYEMFNYLEEGLRIAPDDENLNALLDALMKVGESL